MEKSMMELGYEVLAGASRVIDIAQVANIGAEEEVPAWLGGFIGFAVVMVALATIWIATEMVGVYFAHQHAKGKTAPGKSEAAPKAPVASAQVSAAAVSEVPLAVIVAAAAYTVAAMGQQLRNVVVHVPGRESVSWTAQGRQAIYSGHAPMSPAAVRPIGGIVKK
jgi:hypothetical protein